MTLAIPWEIPSQINRSRRSSLCVPQLCPCHATRRYSLIRAAGANPFTDAALAKIDGLGRFAPSNFKDPRSAGFTEITRYGSLT